MKLYTYFRSSASFRVRIALNIKRLQYDSVAIDLRAPKCEQHSAEYRAVNPQALVPALEVGGTNLGQSLAIIEYIEECYPDPPLLPVTALDRARVRAMALAIACDLHPLNNLRVLTFLRSFLGRNEEEVGSWYQHWVSETFNALELEARRTSSNGLYMFGDGITLADVCLVPQMHNACRFNCNLEPYPTLRSVCAHLQSLPPFIEAAPEAQPNAA
jgi:maleylacetoacetate isomerase